MDSCERALRDRKFEEIDLRQHLCQIQQQKKINQRDTE